MNTEENNKRIAEFMGFTQEKNIGWYDNDMFMSQNVYDIQDGNCFDELQFHKSWDWLMPVIIKMADAREDTHYKLYKTIDEAYEEVVEFINEYNKI